MERPNLEEFNHEASREIVHQALKESGINFVAYLPDDQIHDAQKLIINNPSFITVGAMNESEAVSACAGAWLGGAKPAVAFSLAASSGGTVVGRSAARLRRSVITLHISTGGRQVIDRDSRMAYLDVAGALRDTFVPISA